MKTREDVLEILKQIMEDLFEIDPELVKPEANLYEDLEVDSIDAVDLVVELRKLTGKQIDPDAFKAVRTVDDVINAVTAIITG